MRTRVTQGGTSWIIAPNINTPLRRGISLDLTSECAVRALPYARRHVLVRSIHDRQPSTGYNNSRSVCLHAACECERVRSVIWVCRLWHCRWPLTEVSSCSFLFLVMPFLPRLQRIHSLVPSTALLLLPSAHPKLTTVEPTSRTLEVVSVVDSHAGTSSLL
jgi:hypothetical protein